MESRDEIIKDEEFSPTYEHYSDDVEIGANQSNAGTLGLNQRERRDRFTKPITPHISIIHARDLKQETNWRL